MSTADYGNTFTISNLNKLEMVQTRETELAPVLGIVYLKTHQLQSNQFECYLM